MAGSARGGRGVWGSRSVREGRRVRRFRGAPGAQGKRLGLALGGGAARGFAHLGVLKVLAEEGITVAAVAGTSAGSLVGALYCAGKSWEAIRELGHRIDWPDVVSPTWPSLGLVKTNKLEKVIDRLLEGKSFSQLEVPFKAVAVDIQRGEAVVLDRGPVARAVRASASIPGIFEPTIVEGRYLVDGGLMNDVPVDVVRGMGVEVVLGVNLNRDRISTGKPQSMVDILLRSLNILIYQNTQAASVSADVVVAPELSGFAYQDLSRVDELIARGEAAMRKHIRQLERLL